MQRICSNFFLNHFILPYLPIMPLLKIPKIGFQDQLSLNSGQKYCRILQGEHSAIFSYHLSLRSLFSLFLRSRLTQVLVISYRLVQNVQICLIPLSISSLKGAQRY